MGVLFGQVGFEVGMGVIAAIIAWIKTAPIELLIVLIIGVPVLCRAIGEFFTWWSEKTPLAIEINDGQLLDRLVRNEGETMVVGHIASLQVINRENSDLINCYAVLKKSVYPNNEFDMSTLSTGIGARYIQWKGEKDCKYTTIGAHGGEAILQVFKVSYKHYADDTKTPDFSYFLICGGNHKVTYLTFPVRKLIEIEIVIHAEINGKSAISRPFYGYVEVNIEKDFSGGLKVSKGKPPKQEHKLSNNISPA